MKRSWGTERPANDEGSHGPGGYGPDLARVHHAGFGDVARAAAGVVLARLEARGPGRGTVIDLGCGSGILAARVAAAGHDVLGVDRSPAMLALARETAPASRFLQASLFDLELPPALAVTAIGECLNYSFGGGEVAAGEETVGNLFERVRRSLAPGGFFLFDVACHGRAGAEPVRSFVDGGGAGAPASSPWSGTGSSPGTSRPSCARAGTSAAATRSTCCGSAMRSASGVAWKTRGFPARSATPTGTSASRGAVGSSWLG